MNVVVDLTEAQRSFLASTERKPNGCIVWARGKMRDGYGRLQYKCRTVLAHRMALHLFEGFDLTSPLLVCHHCDNPSCVNPKHLYTGTMLQNMTDMHKRGRAVRKSKLSLDQAFAAVARVKYGQTKTEVARHFKVSMQTIAFILQRYEAGLLGLTKRKTDHGN